MPFRNERVGMKAAELARVSFSHSLFLNTEKQHGADVPEKPLTGKRGDLPWACHTLSDSTSMAAINNTHESQRKSTISLET